MIEHRGIFVFVSRVILLNCTVELDDNSQYSPTPFITYRPDLFLAVSPLSTEEGFGQTTSTLLFLLEIVKQANQNCARNLPPTRRRVSSREIIFARAWLACFTFPKKNKGLRVVLDLVRLRVSLPRLFLSELVMRA